jgi:glycosyltransferase involved in cell wall biosynthesis
MMTIVMVGHKGIPAKSGGIERHVEELSASLVRLGARVISFDRAWYVEDAPSPKGVERRFSHGLHTKHLDAITHTLSALVLAMREKPDVIHVHGVGPSLLLPIARVLHPRARLISTFHCVDHLHAKWGIFARTMLRMGEWMSCAFANRTIAVSDFLATYCLNAYQAQPSVIPNGVRLPNTTAPVAPLDLLSLEPKRYFLMATRLVGHKNAHVAIEAHHLLWLRRPDLAEAFPLVIAGGSSWTAPYARDLRATAAMYPYVRLVGERHGVELASLQNHAACHLSVSESEGMSISLLEAMAMARPVIVSDIPANVEVTGGLAPRVPAGDAHTLSDAMECAALLTDEERDHAGRTLQNVVRERHDWDRIAEATLRVYQEALGETQIANQQAMA